MNIEKKLIDNFYKILETESKYKKILSLEQINKLSEIIGISHKLVKYSRSIKNPLELVLNFYKEIFPEFYPLIIEGINTKRIIFNNSKPVSYTSLIDGKCYIHFDKTDADLFMIAHEFGHYIAINSNPQIIQAENINFGEVLSIYMEKRLGTYLINKYNLTDLVNTRRRNRLYFDENMLKIAKLEYIYENKYISGNLVLCDLDLNNILKITRFKSDNIINNLLAFPLGNIISMYLIDNNIKIDNNLIDVLLNINIDELMNKYANNFKSMGAIKNEKKGISNFFRERYHKFEKNNLPTPFWDEERQTLEYIYFNNSDGIKLKGIDYDNKLHINYNLTDALGDLAYAGFYYAYNSKVFQSKKINDVEIENTTLIVHTHAHSFEEVVHALYNFPESFSISKEDEQFYSKQELEYLRRVKKYLLFIGLKDSVDYKHKVGRYRNNKQKKYENAFIYKYSNKDITSFIKGKNYLIYEYLDFYKENRVFAKGEYQALIVDNEDNFRIFIEFTHENVQSYYSVKKVYHNDNLKDNDKVLVRYFKILEKYE